MQMDSSAFLTLALNIGFILALSWLGIKLLSNSSVFCPSANRTSILVSQSVNETTTIILRLKQVLRIRRMIKTDSDDDESPFLLPQLES